ncbi:TadA family conjugal transfer-associated ATPase [Mycetocola zhujimingii]|uniref:TadA family conjugal transfer-associated ATPase n=1 Tax=Mycetocola zhujimingii TaxID=2079792 RepID=UPI0018E0AF38
MSTRFVATPAAFADSASGAPPPAASPHPVTITASVATNTAEVAKDRFVPSAPPTSVGPRRSGGLPRSGGASQNSTGEAPVGLVDASPDVGGPAGPAGSPGSVGEDGPPGFAGPDGAPGPTGIANAGRPLAVAAHRAGSTGARPARVGRSSPTAVRLRLSLAAEFGPLGQYLVEDAVTDIFINGEYGGLWIDRGDGLQHDQRVTLSEREARDLAVRLVGLGGRHIDEATPCMDVRLPGGIRVHAVLPPVSVTGTLISIRVPQVRRLDLSELGAAGMFGSGTAIELAAAVRERTNLLITGAAGTGKTTLLGAMLASAPSTERIVAIEDVAELGVEHPHFVSLESRQPNLEGAGAISMDRLVREALRMRPDRLVVGECRGAEVRELLAALNTGHDGGAGTLHANSLADVPARIEALGALAGMTADAVARQTVSAIGLVIHLERVDGVRRVARQGRFALDPAGRLAITEAPG